MLKRLIKKSLFSKSYKNLYSTQVSPSSELTIKVKEEIEKKWEEVVTRSSFCSRDENRVKFYVLSMFPYPSGKLHIGHVRVYAISDAIARFQRFNGKNVFLPMGFDAFGLPAENAAIKSGVPAADWTWSNIKAMRNQLKNIGCSFDWDSEIVTCDPKYFKFTQKLFLLLHKAGLVYRAGAVVNWDPVDKTVLANEQVDSQGRSWRSCALVEKRLLKQWFIKTTSFAQSLYEGLSDPCLKDWRDVIDLQKHWIGECNGAAFHFPVLVNGLKVSSARVWTRFPEAINRVRFIAVTRNSELLMKYGKDSEIQLENPFNNSKLSVYETDKVDFDEGCDLKLGMPAVFEKDKQFGLEVGVEFEEEGFEEDAVARQKVVELAREAGVGGDRCSSKLKDWLISRQRFWGTPIPMVHCPACGEIPVPEEHLPVLLPPSASADLEAWKRTVCPSCGAPAHRELDTMDTFVDSSWYYLRYLDPLNNDSLVSKDRIDSFMPVDLYIGGKEHAVLHLYYARFMGHFLHSIGLLQHPEPFRQLLVQGMVKGKTYVVKETGKYLTSTQILNKGKKNYEKTTNLEVEEVWEKMSKSKHNGVDAKEVLDKFGIDSTRLMVLCDASPTSPKLWKPEHLDVVLKWQEKLWVLLEDFKAARSADHPLPPNLEEIDGKLWSTHNYYISKVTYCYSVNHQLAHAIAKLHGLTTVLKKCSPPAMAHSLQFELCLGFLLIGLAPIAPHFASELWHRFLMAPRSRTFQTPSWAQQVLQEHWPKLDPTFPLRLFVSVNNAVKEVLTLPHSELRALSSQEASSLALAQPKVRDFIGPCDILGYDFSLIPFAKASLNISIDHTQKWTADSKKTNNNSQTA